MNVVEKRSDNSRLPEEIETDILSRLPVKSVKRFESACKSWSLLFRTHYFITKHLCHSAKKPCLLIYDHLSSEHRDGIGQVTNIFALNREALVLEPTPYFLFQHYRITGSCNGILCLVRDSCRYKQPVFSLWNPATGQTRFIPEFPKRIPSFLDCLFGCAAHSTGFGCDSITNDYKFVLLLLVRTEYSAKLFFCGVYSCASHSWNSSSVSVLKNLEIDPDQIPVSLHGHLYWLGNEVDDENLDYSFDVVLAFDLNRNAFDKIRLPFSLDMRSRRSQLLIYKETSLAVIGVSRSDSGCFFQIWVATVGSVGKGEAGLLWNLIFSVDQQILYIAGECKDCNLTLYPFAFCGDEIVVTCFNCDSFLFNYKTHETKKFKTGLSNLLISPFFNYVESLVPLSTVSEEQNVDSELQITA